MSKHPRIDLKTPCGRLVAGNLATASEGKGKYKKDKPQYFFALAVSKHDPQISQLLQQIIGHAWQTYQFAPPVIQRIQNAPYGDPLRAANFAWKIDDGDDPKFADKEGYPGSWILKFATTIPFRCADAGNQQLDPNTIDLGNYGDVAFSVEINGNIDDTAGIYLNPVCFRLLGFGTKIISGPSIDQLMGNAPAQLPPGASMTPVAPSGMPDQPAYGAPGGQNPMLPEGYASGQGAPAGAQPIQPAHGAAQPGYPATAYPSNPMQPQANTTAPSAGNYGQPQNQPSTAAYPSNVQPHPTFANGGQQ